MLLYKIICILTLSKASHGSPRIAEELKKQGFGVLRQRVVRLMKNNNIRAVHTKKFVVTTDAKHSYEVMENKLNREFSATKPATVWVSDITYTKTGEGWCI